MSGGLEVNAHVRAYRGSGFSTCSAFFFIAEALANPGERVNVRDHHDTVWSHTDLTKRVKEIAARTDIGLEVDIHGLWIKAPVRGVKQETWTAR